MKYKYFVSVFLTKGGISTFNWVVLERDTLVTSESDIAEIENLARQAFQIGHTDSLSLITFQKLG